MRRFFPLVFLLSIGLGVGAEEETALRAQPWFSPCEILCANLTKAIEERPDLMIMRLEDALVINEPCAPEIVTAAMDAVKAKPHLVKQILETALKVAPSRSDAVLAAVRNYTPGKTPLLVMEEVRRAEIPATAPLMEIRRAEVAGSNASQPIEEIRRAVVPSATGDTAAVQPPVDSPPREEIRRAEMILTSSSSYTR